jgi:predicted nucleotidyltransferase
MLNKNHIKILEKMIKSLRSEYTLMDLSRELKQDYSRTYKDIDFLITLGLITSRKVGKSRVIGLDFSKYHPEYALVEIERLNNILKNKNISSIYDKILKINKPFVCVLFGSYASGKFGKNSDIDLLFVIPEDYDLNKFENTAKNNLAMYNIDINVVTENSLFEMLAHPEKMNVGNELLKNHVTLFGADYFINLVRQHYVGR